MQLLALILLSTLSYSVYDVFAAKAGGRIEANLSAVIINGLGTVLPLIALAIIHLSNRQVDKTYRDGLLYSVIAGVAIAAFSVLIMKVFASGGNLSYVIPLVYGGVIILTSLFGLIFWHEPISLMQLFGLSMTFVGIAVVIFSKFQPS